MTNKQIVSTGFEGLYVVNRTKFVDNRGSFDKLFCKKSMLEINNFEVKQINISYTKERGSVRGMHLQTAPHAEKKIVTCIEGSVLDIVVDLNRHSKTYKKVFKMELSFEKQNSLVIPEGFAHGFQTLTDNCKLLYAHSNVYSPNSETGINIYDDCLQDHWPLIIKNLSERDKKLPSIKDFERLH